MEFSKVPKNMEELNMGIRNITGKFYFCNILICTQYASKFGKTQQGPQDWKRSVSIPNPKKDNAKECSNYCTITLISHTSEEMLKICQVMLQQYMN